MADHPIIFSGSMVRALLDGRKTQTRRVLKPQPFRTYAGWGCVDHLGSPQAWLPSLPGLVKFRRGDRLYVREACATWEGRKQTAEYRADRTEDEWADIAFDAKNGAEWKLRSPIHMPRWASRLTLIVSEVRVKRLQEISEADAVAEGVVWQEPTDDDRAWAKQYADENGGSPDIDGVWIAPGTRQGWGATPEIRDLPQWGPTAAFAFRSLWNSLHGPEAWDANPWVAAISFTVHRCNIDQMQAQGAIPATAPSWPAAEAENTTLPAIDETTGALIRQPVGIAFVDQALISHTPPAESAVDMWFREHDEDQG